MSKTRLRQTDPAKERYWRDVVHRQPLSGQSVREYCLQTGVKESAFYWWRRELARRSETRKADRPRPARGQKPEGSSASEGNDQPEKLPRGRRPRRGKPNTARPLGSRSSASEASPFVPIHLLADNSPANAPGVEIHLSNGGMICVRPGFDRQTLEEVLAALEVRPC